MIEIWKDIEGYEGRYQVSNFGNVKSLRYRQTNKEKCLAKSNNGLGYYQVTLKKNGSTKIYYVHRLVAKAFISNPNKYKEINHIDENKNNNCVENLEWCDRKYNVNCGSVQNRRAKSIGTKVIQIETGRVFDSYKHASKETGICASGIRGVCDGLHKTAGGFKWQKA